MDDRLEFSDYSEFSGTTVALGALRLLRSSRVALTQPDACGAGESARDHEPGSAMSRLMATWRCRVRAAPRLRRASRPRHRQPCGFHRLAGHECRLKRHTNIHESFHKTHCSTVLVTLLAAGGILAFAVLGAVYEAEKPGVTEARRTAILKWVPQVFLQPGRL